MARIFHVLYQEGAIQQKVDRKNRIKSSVIPPGVLVPEMKALADWLRGQGYTVREHPDAFSASLVAREGKRVLASRKFKAANPPDTAVLFAVDGPFHGDVLDAILAALTAERQAENAEMARMVQIARGEGDPPTNDEIVKVIRRSAKIVLREMKAERRRTG